MRLKSLWKPALFAASLAAAVTPFAADAKQPDYAPSYARDRAEIEDLMARYLFAIDYADWDAYVETFAPDGELTFASGTSNGRTAIREAVTRFDQGIARADQVGAVRQHPDLRARRFSGLVVLRVAGLGWATARQGEAREQGNAKGGGRRGGCSGHGLSSNPCLKLTTGPLRWRR